MREGLFDDGAAGARLDDAPPSGALPSGALPSGALPSGALLSGALLSGALPSGALLSGALPSGALLSGALPVGVLVDDVLPGGGLSSVFPVDPLAEELAARELVGEVVMRDGVLVRVVPEDQAPPGGWFDPFEAFDEAWYRNTAQAWDPDAPPAPDSGPDSVAGAGAGSVAGVGPGSGRGSGSGRDNLDNLDGLEGGSGRPPAGVPVVLWPEATLRQALRVLPGVGLARVVAEAIDLDDNLVAHPGAGLDGDLGGGVPAAQAGDSSNAVRDGLSSEVWDGLSSEVWDGLSDDALGDLVVACGRLQSWAAGVQARVVAERAARESHPLAHNSLVGQVTGELKVTEQEATEVVVRAEAGAQHPTVIHALTTGRIDTRKAHVLLRSASQLTVTERAEAIRLYLPRAPHRTWKWLQARMLAFAKARHGAARAAKAAVLRRGVQIDRAEDDMGWLSAYLPATDAAAVWGVVDDMAHQLRHATGEDRTLGQLRADSLTGIITGRLLPADRFTHSDTHTHTHTGTGTGTDDGTDDGKDGADGTRGADGSDGSVSDSDANDSVTNDSVTNDSVTNDSVTNDSVTNDSVTGDGDGRDGTDVGTQVPVCTCGGRAPVIQKVVQEVVRPVRVIPTRPVIQVTIPATALLGLDDAPGHLNGYGPIPADTARTLATDATWRRLLTDPTTGILTDYSTTTYQPGKTLRTAIETRDQTCTFLWGCDTPATHSDLDHIVPFNHKNKDQRDTGGRGQTNAHNLHALCRKHHLLKTHAGWGIVRDPTTGVTTWTTPTGGTHTRPPTVLDTHIDLHQIDPDTSQDLTLRALTGQRLPQPYDTTQPGTTPTKPTSTTGTTTLTAPSSPIGTVHPDEPPF